MVMTNSDDNGDGAGGYRVVETAAVVWQMTLLRMVLALIGLLLMLMLMMVSFDYVNCDSDDDDGVGVNA